MDCELPFPQQTANCLSSAAHKRFPWSEFILHCPVEREREETRHSIFAKSHSILFNAQSIDLLKGAPVEESHQLRNAEQIKGFIFNAVGVHDRVRISISSHSLLTDNRVFCRRACYVTQQFRMEKTCQGPKDTAIEGELIVQ